MENTNQSNESQVNNKPANKSKTKKIILIIVILLAIGGAMSYFLVGNFNNRGKIGISSVGDSVAVVNGEKILKSEFDLRIVQTKEIAKSQGANLSDEKAVKEIEKNALNEMINEKILLQDAKKKGLIASIADVEKAYNEIFAKFKNKDDFAKELATQNLTEQSLKDNIVRQLTLVKYIDQSIDSKSVVVSEKEVSETYKALSQKQKNALKFEQMKTQIENEIKQGKLRTMILDLVAKLKAGAKIDISAQF